MSTPAMSKHANAVRIPPADLLTETRTVIVHLTPFAPGCATASVRERARNRTFWERPVGGIIRAILTRLNRVPSDVRVKTDARGDPALSGEVDPFGQVPLAFFWEGLTVPEIVDALGELARRGWAAPMAPAPFPSQPPLPLRSIESLVSFDERFRA